MTWIILLGVFFYFLPTLEALCKGHRNTAAIAATNVLFGWTILGWCIALIWSLTDPKK